MKKIIVLMSLFSSILLLSMCTKDYVVINEDTPLTPYFIETPYRFPDMPMNPDNPLTEEGIALGRQLYYDSLLDKNQARSCASCHVQSTAFTTFESNAQQHINLGWHTNWLWKGEVVGSVEDVMHFEVADFFETDFKKLNNNAAYRKEFKKVFGVETITAKEAAKALSQFVRTMISSDSKFDKYLRSEIGLTNSELNGMSIFFSEKGDCFHCHGSQLFSDNLFHNTGLDASPDDGRMEVTGNPMDKGAFKTPTLRNIELTAPYMHDGRFNTLEEVVDFYSEELKSSPTVSPLMKQLHQGGVRLKPDEKKDLVAFLKTLTDNTFITNQAFAAP